MKISFVVPDFLSGTSFLQQPLDFLYSATILERSGYEVSIVDCRTSHQSKVDLFKSISGSDLIITTTTPCDQVQNYFVDYRYAYAIQLINFIKEFSPEIPLAVCGAHCTVRPDLVQKEIKADILIFGEMIYTALELARVIENHLDLNIVPNIAYFCDSTWIKTNYDANLLHPNLENSILPAFDKVPMSSYFGVEYKDNIPLRRQNRAVLQGGRGCPYSCHFCHNFYGHKVKRRPVEILVQEMEICQNQYGVKEIFFLDELFTMDEKWIHDFCQEVKRKNLKLALTIQTRVDCINADILDDLYSVGVRDIWLGIENADNDVLRLSNKGEVNDILVPSISLIKSCGINPNAFFMLGMPGETIATINKTLKSIYTQKISYTRSIMICTPRFGTPLYELAVSQYPYIKDSFYNLNAVKGLVANEMTPHILQKAKDVLKDRDFLYKSNCPQL